MLPRTRPPRNPWPRAHIRSPLPRWTRRPTRASAWRSVCPACSSAGSARSAACTAAPTSAAGRAAPAPTRWAASPGACSPSAVMPPVVFTTSRFAPLQDYALRFDARSDLLFAALARVSGNAPFTFSYWVRFLDNPTLLPPTSYPRAGPGGLPALLHPPGVARRALPVHITTSGIASLISASDQPAVTWWLDPLSTSSAPTSSTPPRTSSTSARGRRAGRSSPPCTTLT